MTATARQVFTTYAKTRYAADQFLFRLTPASVSDFDAAYTYESYVAGRYRVRSVDPEQPMLQAVLNERSKPRLIPELCRFQEGVSVHPELYAQMRMLCAELSARWDRDFAANATAKVYPRTRGRGRAEPSFAFNAPSSLVLALQSHAWMPATDPWATVGGDRDVRDVRDVRRRAGQPTTLVPPRLCYVATPEIRDLLGAQVSFTFLLSRP